jgi:hypothetical protein
MYLSRSTALHCAKTKRFPLSRSDSAFDILDTHTIFTSQSLHLSWHKMKSSTFICLAAAGSAHAFPNVVHNLAQRDHHPRAESDSWGGLFPLVEPSFDAAAQYVDTTGEHAWKAPGEHDQRGPCPGLNALANHGYLPHNGIGTLDQFIDACIKGKPSLRGATVSLHVEFSRYYLEELRSSWRCAIRTSPFSRDAYQQQLLTALCSLRSGPRLCHRPRCLSSRDQW